MMVNLIPKFYKEFGMFSNSPSAAKSRIARR